MLQRLGRSRPSSGQKESGVSKSLGTVMTKADLDAEWLRVVDVLREACEIEIAHAGNALDRALDIR